MSSDKYDDGPDPYTSPNSQILINKLGITDNDQFIEMEKRFFREGSGWAQRLLFEHIIINCGFQISFSDVNPDGWIQANIDGYHCRYQP